MINAPLKNHFTTLMISNVKKLHYKINNNNYLNSLPKNKDKQLEFAHPIKFMILYSKYAKIHLMLVIKNLISYYKLNSQKQLQTLKNKNLRKKQFVHHKILSGIKIYLSAKNVLKVPFGIH